MPAAGRLEPDDVIVATKGGLTRSGPGRWAPVGRPEYLRQCVEMSLRRLRLEAIDLYQLHRIDPQVPLADQVGVLGELRREGKIAHIGLSEVNIAEIVEARLTAPVVSVQNRYNLVTRKSEEVLDYCEREGLGFIPWFPMATGQLAGADGPLSALAKQADVTPAQLALAWLLRRSPVMLPIPGTGGSPPDHRTIRTALPTSVRGTVPAGSRATRTERPRASVSRAWSSGSAGSRPDASVLNSQQATRRC